jgi:DNA polymerase-3 subunit beta
MVAEAEVKGDGDGDITVPGRKLHDIFRALPEGVSVEFTLSGDRLTIKAGRSRFTLSTLRAADFPTIDEIGAKQTLRLNKADLRRLVEKTHFSMANRMFGTPRGYCSRRTETPGPSRRIASPACPGRSAGRCHAR